MMRLGILTLLYLTAFVSVLGNGAIQAGTKGSETLSALSISLVGEAQAEEKRGQVKNITADD